MFRADVVLFQPIGFTDGHFHDPFRPRRRAQLAARIGSPTDLLFNGTGNIFRRQAQLGENQAGNAVLFKTGPSRICLFRRNHDEISVPYPSKLKHGFGIIGKSIVAYGKSLLLYSRSTLLHRLCARRCSKSSPLNSEPA